MHNIHGSKSKNMMNATTVQNDVIVRRFIISMNMAMDAQDEYVIMQLMMGNMIMMYEYAIKVDHKILLRKCTSSYIMGIQDATRQS